MVKNIDFTIFVSIYPFVSLFVSSLVLFDRSFVHLFVGSCVCGRVVILSSGRLVVCSAGRVFVCFFSAFGRLFVWSCDRLVISFAWSFNLFFVCSSVFDLFIYFVSFQRVVCQKLFTSMEYPKIQSSPWVCCSLPRKKPQTLEVKTARHRCNV